MSGRRAIPRFAGLSLDRPRIMGIVNVTPDSFSDGGDLAGSEAAIAHGRVLLEQGADILDVGGESTRPGAEPVPEELECRRVLPVIRGLAEMGATISVDTRKARVMAAAVDAGATIINDVTALTSDPDSLATAADCGAAVILMHMQGEPGSMQKDPQYTDAARDVLSSLERRVRACERAGISRERIALDPGIGFGKTVAHNLDILNRLGLYAALELPLVLGVSRKSFIARLSKGEGARDRLPGSVAAALAGIVRGVHILRVHDVAATRQALDVWLAIEGAHQG